MGEMTIIEKLPLSELRQHGLKCTFLLSVNSAEEIKNRARENQV